MSDCEIIQCEKPEYENPLEPVNTYYGMVHAVESLEDVTDPNDNQIYVVGDSAYIYVNGSFLELGSGGSGGGGQPDVMLEIALDPMTLTATVNTNGLTRDDIAEKLQNGGIQKAKITTSIPGLGDIYDICPVLMLAVTDVGTYFYATSTLLGSFRMPSNLSSVTVYQGFVTIDVISGVTLQSGTVKAVSAEITFPSDNNGHLSGTVTGMKEEYITYPYNHSYTDIVLGEYLMKGNETGDAFISNTKLSDITISTGYVLANVGYSFETNFSI